MVQQELTILVDPQKIIRKGYWEKLLLIFIGIHRKLPVKEPFFLNLTPSQVFALGFKKTFRKEFQWNNFLKQCR